VFNLNKTALLTQKPWGKKYLFMKKGKPKKYYLNS